MPRLALRWLALTSPALLLPSAAVAQIIDDVLLLSELAGGTSATTSWKLGPADDVVGSGTDGTGVERAIAWSSADFNASGIVLPPIAPTMDSWANDVSYDSGTATKRVVGASIDLMGTTRPVLWVAALADTAYEADSLRSEVDAAYRRGGRLPGKGIANLRRWAECARRMGRSEEAVARLEEARDRWAEEFGEGANDYAAIERELASARAGLAGN